MIAAAESQTDARGSSEFCVAQAWHTANFFEEHLAGADKYEHETGSRSIRSLIGKGPDRSCSSEV